MGGVIWPVQEIGTRTIYRRVGNLSGRGFLPAYVVWDYDESKEQYVGEAKTLREARRIAGK